MKLHKITVSPNFPVHSLILVTFTNGVMFLPHSGCLSVCPQTGLCEKFPCNFHETL